jgi:hypothetical protein
MNKAWQDHCRHVTLIRSIFLYLDRTFVLQSSETPSLWQMGLNLFHDIILNVPQIQSKLIDGLLEKIYNEHMGQKIDRILLKNITKMLVEMHIYEDVFEHKFITVISDFYRKEAAEYIQSHNVSLIKKHMYK